jgi:hypothetical protein
MVIAMFKHLFKSRRRRNGLTINIAQHGALVHGMGGGVEVQAPHEQAHCSSRHCLGVPSFHKGRLPDIIICRSRSHLSLLVYFLRISARNDNQSYGGFMLVE